MRPVEREGLPSEGLTPEQVKQQAPAFANYINAQTQVDEATARLAKSPKNTIYQQQLESAKSVFDVAKTAYGISKMLPDSGGAGGNGDKTDDGTKDVKAKEDTGPSKETQDAFALLKETFAEYGLDELSSIIEGYMKANLGTAEARLKLKETEAYKTRFKGNELRRAKGLNVLSEADYLYLEKSYSETLKAYGLQNYFGSAATKEDKKNRDLKLADIIGNDVSAVEFKDRVSTAVDRVTNADAYTKSAFKQFYNINDTDLVGYFLDPTKALNNLKEKAAAAEIGGAALGQNLAATSATAEELARFGVTREQAVQGYANIAEILPTAQKLSSIYSQEGITYGQTEAEQEAFKGLASEQRKRKQLMARETAAFGGSSGIGRSSLGSGSTGAI